MSRVLPTIRGLENAHRIGNAVRIGLTLVITACLVSTIFLNSYSSDVNKGLADNLIRLHVIANSDSSADQALKRDVRDAVLAYLKDRLKDSRDMEQTKYIINSNRESILTIARDEIKKYGSDYSVTANLGSYPFPTKAYGDITLPAGNYQALRVVIGKGEGANWWCVLFPPLCFVDVTHGAVPDSVKEELKKNLSSEEYSIIASADDDGDIPVKIKFKIVEFFEDSKIKLTGMISKMIS